MKLSEWWESVPREEKFVVYGLILAILITVAYYVIKKLRGETRGDIPSTTDYLGAFRELHSEGTIDEVEFEKLKTTISQQTLDEINESNDAEPESTSDQQLPEESKSLEEARSRNDDKEDV